MSTSNRWSWVGFTLFTAALLWLTLTPMDGPSVNPGGFIDKIAHFSLFGLWSYLLGSFMDGKWTGVQLFAFTAIAGTLFGAIVEGLQLTLDMGRSFEVMDMVANTAGAACAGIATSLNLGLRRWRTD
ncbi:MAG: VanZ family protein [Balneolaceae bacterium]|nr:VanZ family protein [Balneolaceae bacterium]MDR9446620.1 VanZ family protein [Balneolaceae bacterium]